MLVKTTRVQRLEIKNFRGIRSLVLDFDGNVTVLVGVNGVGKTSILESLRLLFARLLNEVLTSVQGRFRVPKDLFAQESLKKADVHLAGGDVSLRAVACVAGTDLDWSTDDIFDPDDPESEVTPVVLLAHYLFETEAPTSEMSLPLAVYYSLGRGSEPSDEASREDPETEQVWAYAGALSGLGASSVARFVDWFRKLEDYENERRTEDSAFRDNQLQAVRSVVDALLHDFSSLRIRRQPTRMVIRKGQVELDVRQLSDGERYLLALGADIARRLALANPAAENARLCSAVVLIDEIETHLHPSWQRRVIPSLVQAFPNCQFIVATHSPQVLSNVKPESIYVLTQQDGEVRAEHPEASFGRDSNRILEDLMGVDERPIEIKNKLGNYFQLIDEGRTEEAQVLRRELEASIGSSDPEFTRADVLLHTRELLSR